MEKSSHISSVLVTYSTSDWSVKMRLLRFPVMSHKQISGEI